MVRHTDPSNRESARQWARRMSRPIDLATFNAFEIWARQAPQNWRLFVLALVEYEVEVESGATRAPVLTLPARTSAFSDVYRPTRIVDDNRWARIGRKCACAVGACLAVLTLTTFVAPQDGTRIVDPAGDTDVFRLEDGSMITADPGSQYRVKFTDQERVVEFDRGSAVFEVRKDESRAFTVAFRGGSVESVGTRFRVADEDDQIEVEVFRGLVRIHSVQLGQDAMPLAVGGSVHISPKGLVSVVVRGPAVVTSDRPVSASLREIEAAYNARHPDRPLEVDSEVQHDRILLGLHELDPEHLLSTLETLQRYDVVRDPDRIVVKLQKQGGTRAAVKAEP